MRTLLRPWLSSILALAFAGNLVNAQTTEATVETQRITVQARLTAADPADPFDFSHSAKDTSFKARRGTTVRLTVKATPREGYHSYPFSKLAPGQDRAFLSTIRFKLPEGIVPLWPGHEQPEPKLVTTRDFKSELEQEGPFVWSQDLLILDEAKPGPHPLELHLWFQVCDANSCSPEMPVLKLSLDVSSEGPVPLTQELEKRRKAPVPELQKSWRVELLKPAAPSPKDKDRTPTEAPTAAPTSGISVSQEQYAEFMTELLPGKINLDESKKLFTQRRDTSLWLFIFMGMAWGGISLITPCVFPMIPITVSFFLKQSEKQHHRPITMASVYSLTIVVVLTLAATLFIHFFRWLSINPITNWLIGALFIYFALSLFGMYDIELPSGLARFTSAHEGQGGLVGTIFMALTFTIISFACVAPFLGGFAGISATDRPFEHILLGGLAFAVTFAAPFFLLALFPTVLRKLPKSGSWLNTVKVVMGFLELAAALKFLRAAELLSTARPSFFTFDLVLGIYVALALLCGLYLLNVYRLPHDSPVESLSVPRLMFALAFVTLGLYLLPGLFRFSADGEQQRPRGTLYAWVESFLLPESRPTDKIGNLEYAIAQAREHRRKTGERKLIFVDVTGFS